MRGKWPISQPFVVRFSKFFCLVEAFENPHWFLLHKRLSIVHRLAARGRRSDEGQSRQFFQAKNPKFSILSYKHVIYLKWKLKLCRIQIHNEKIWFDSRKFKKIHFSDFCLKNEADQVSSRADFSKSYQQISKMALPGAGRSFNLKSHQRRTHYLHPIQNGSRSPEHGAIVPPPPRLE